MDSWMDGGGEEQVAGWPATYFLPSLLVGRKEARSEQEESRPVSFPKRSVSSWGF